MVDPLWQYEQLLYVPLIFVSLGNLRARGPGFARVLGAEIVSQRKRKIGYHEEDRRYCTGSSDACGGLCSEQCMGPVPCGMSYVGTYNRSMGWIMFGMGSWVMTC